MRAPETEDVAEVEIERGAVGHRREGTKPPPRDVAGTSQENGWPWAGTRFRVVAGSVIRSSTGTTSTVVDGLVAPSWAMIPPTRVSEPTITSGLPIARIVNGSR